MNDHGLAVAQTQYDAQMPAEGTRRCTCGCDWGDHLKTVDPERMEGALKDILRIANEWPKASEYLTGQRIIRVAMEGLAKCNGTDCACREFSPAERGDDRY